MADIPPTRPTTQPYDKWLHQWSLHMGTASEIVRVASEIVRLPLEATYVTTPLVSNHWSTLLAGHPDETLIRFFISGISRGFRIGFSHPLSNLSSAKRNLYCALQHSTIVDQYLSEELSHHHIQHNSHSQCPCQHVWGHSQESSA